jgi:3-phenylpropionate/trans-cinnamate dioxygenase ferredoxin reductase component
MNVNLWDVTEPIEHLVQSERRIDVDKLTDVDVPLGDVLD